MFARDEADEAKTPCAVCQRTACCQVWGIDLCVDCNAAWSAQAPTSGDVDRALGFDPMAPTVEGQLEKVCAEFRRRALAWSKTPSRRAS